MSNEKLKQIRESITNTVSCIDSDNGNYFANALLIGHLKALTDMEAALLRVCTPDKSITPPAIVW